jgi:hypothetical protein
MKTQRIWKQAVLIIGLLSIVSTLVYADRDDRKDRERYDRRDRQEYGEKWQGHGERNFKAPPKGYILDRRYQHDRYYPRQGYSITKLPPNYYRYHYRDRDYYFHGGVWYGRRDGSYFVVRPSIGWFIPVLPAFYTTIWFGGIPYYYANDVYYVWDPSRSGYIVTNPPADINAQEAPPVMSEQLYIYPKQGQTEQQQANDRYACHEWGVKQTGYDPTQPPANMSQDELNNRREEYRRAMKACLEGRGYSVN